MKVYTKSGDVGNTSLYTGERVAKYDLRVEAYGTLDELQAFLGMARVQCTDLEVKGVITGLENTLTKIMGEVASSGNKNVVITEESVAEIERKIDYFSEQVTKMNLFEVPGTNELNATFHIARTIARRAERRLWEAAEEYQINANLIIWVNRVSDLIFIMSKYIDEKTI